MDHFIYNYLTLIRLRLHLYAILILDLKDNMETSDEIKSDESMSSLFDTFLRQLITCRNRDFIDEVSWHDLL